MTRIIIRRGISVCLAVILAVVGTVVLAPRASAVVNPTSIKCTNLLTRIACNQAKDWYASYWDYGTVAVPYRYAGTTAARDGLRVMAAMAVGNAIGGTDSGLLDNIDLELGRLWQSSGKMACAKGALYDTANTIRERRQAITGMEHTFTVMKAAAGKNRTLKAYAQIGKASMSVADRLNQRKRAEELQYRLILC